jgi:hypothetical protein
MPPTGFARRSLLDSNPCTVAVDAWRRRCKLFEKRVLFAQSFTLGGPNTW